MLSIEVLVITNFVASIDRSEMRCSGYGCHLVDSCCARKDWNFPRIWSLEDANKDYQAGW